MAWRIEELADTFAAFGRELTQIDLGSARARESWKAIVSVFLSLLLSFFLLNLSDSSWAAFSAFMVPRASAGETGRRGLDRVLGTVAGAGLGFLLAGLVVNGALAMLLGMMLIGFISIFQSQISRHSYAWMFFGLTGEMVLAISLASPHEATPFVAIRIGEIVIGVLACIIVACLFEVFWPIPEQAAPEQAPATPAWRGWLDENWLRYHQVSLRHALRGAVAVAVLFTIWRLVELTAFIDSIVSAYMVLLIPGAQLRKGGEEAVATRGMQRLVGCLLGGLFALLTLVVVKDSIRMWVVGLAAGVWIGAWVQNGKAASYAGSQFALALLITLVQGSGPPETLLPAWLRLQGIFVGVFAIGLVHFLWPLPAPPVAEQRMG